MDKKSCNVSFRFFCLNSFLFYCTIYICMFCQHLLIQRTTLTLFDIHLYVTVTSYVSPSFINLTPIHLLSHSSFHSFSVLRSSINVYQLFIRIPFTPSITPIQTIIQSIIQSFNHSFIQSLIHSPIHPTHPLSIPRYRGVGGGGRVLAVEGLPARWGEGTYGGEDVREEMRRGG